MKEQAEEVVEEEEKIEMEEEMCREKLVEKLKNVDW